MVDKVMKLLLNVNHPGKGTLHAIDVSRTDWCFLEWQIEGGGGGR